MSNSKTDILQELISEVVDFRDERDWKQFHNGKDLSMCIAIEAAELQEVFLWRKPEEADVSKVKEELADVLIASLLLAHEYELDLPTIIRTKLQRNKEKYPVEKAKGSNKKYDQL